MDEPLEEEEDAPIPEEQLEPDQADLTPFPQSRGSNFSLDDIRKPLRPSVAKNKSVGPESAKPVAEAPINQGFSSKAYNLAAGAVRAFRGGFAKNKSAGPESSQKDEEQKKQNLDQSAKQSAVKTGKAVAGIVASGGTNVLAWGKAIFEGAKALTKYARAHWKEFLLAFLIWIIIGISLIGILGMGISSKLPGNNTGTTFAQVAIPFESLDAIRRAAEGEQRTQALIKQLQEKGASVLVSEINNIVTETEKSPNLTEKEKGELKALADSTVQILNNLATMPIPDDPTQADENFLTQVDLAVKNIVTIIDTFEKIVYGAAGPSGFYQLPDLPYYVRRSGKESRQWGQKVFLQMLQVTGRQFSQKYPNYKIMIGDISCQDGGYMPTTGNCEKTRTERDSELLALLKLLKDDEKSPPRVTSHKCGLDADVYVTEKDKAEISDLFLVSNGHNPTEGRRMVVDLADIFFAAGIDRIDYASVDSPKFTQALGDHTDHMHIRMKGGWNYPQCVTKQ